LEQGNDPVCPVFDKPNNDNSSFGCSILCIRNMVAWNPANACVVSTIPYSAFDK
jgi:hypothetical protein